MDIDQSFIAADQCADAFSRMFWAFPFFLDIRIDLAVVHIDLAMVHIDLLPDFIGWAIFAFALKDIAPLSSVVPKLAFYAKCLAFLSLFTFLNYKFPVAHFENRTVSVSPTFPIELITSILGLVLIWRLCDLVVGMSNLVSDQVNKVRAKFRRLLYFAFYILLPTIVSLSLFFSFLYVIVAVVLLPGSILASFLMMGLMSRTAKMCRGYTAQ